MPPRVAQHGVGEGCGRRVPALNDRALGARRVNLLLEHHHYQGPTVCVERLVRGRGWSEAEEDAGQRQRLVRSNRQSTVEVEAAGHD